MAATGQTFNDRLNAVRYALVGQGLARTVCKATTEEVLGPKRKHIEYLLACTNEPNVSIPQLANLLIERTRHQGWAVVFKSLITIHHLMSQGNERFTQYLATSNHSFELNDFLDRTTPQGYNMSNFVRTYAKYINDKTVSYRKLALDLCKIRGGNDNALRTMNMDNLSKTLPIVQKQFDSLLGFGAEAKDLNNGVIIAAFRLLYKDLVRIYVAYQEAIINLLERYFKLSRKKTREALEMYRKYLARMDKAAGFLRVVDAVGLDKSEMPDLTNSPGSILKVLEEHLAGLEAKKRGGATPASPEPETVSDSGNKENAQPNSSSASDVTSSKRVEDEPAVPEAKDAAQAPASSEQSDKPSATPKKPPPVRPSPIVSPKVSPSSSKAPGTDIKATPSGKKSAPPERPMKPPSRPPPPSSSQPPAASSSQAKKSPTKAPTPPPPHPPPPTHRAPQQVQTDSPANTSEATPEKQKDESTTSQTQQPVSGGTNAEDVQPVTAESPPAPAVATQATTQPPPLPTGDGDSSTVPSCSSIGETAINQRQTIGEQQLAASDINGNETEINHVANSNGNESQNGAVEGDDMPPPPIVNDEINGVHAAPEQREELPSPSPPPPIDEISEPQVNGNQRD